MKSSVVSFFQVKLIKKVVDQILSRGRIRVVFKVVDKNEGNSNSEVEDNFIFQSVFVKKLICIKKFQRLTEVCLSDF